MARLGNGRHPAAAPYPVCRADFDEAVAELVAVITELRPHVVVTYDPEGGYGHPDHIQTHRVTTAAVAAAAPTWRVSKFYWTVMSGRAFRAGMKGIGTTTR